MNETPPPDDQARQARIDTLLDAIELIRTEQREAALALLRGLIREDADFEYAWLWMSVAVETLDQSAVCLDNVLRINPDNRDAAAAYYRISIPDMQMRARRDRLRMARDVAGALFWGMVVMLVCRLWFGMGEAMEMLINASATPMP